MPIIQRLQVHFRTRPLFCLQLTAHSAVHRTLEGKIVRKEVQRKRCHTGAKTFNVCCAAVTEAADGLCLTRGSAQPFILLRRRVAVHPTIALDRQVSIQHEHLSFSSWQTAISKHVLILGLTVPMYVVNQMSN